ncbi:MAG: hypothetical protein ACE5PO_09410 [Candidatus Bathyarchaeia archaeon]
MGMNAHVRTRPKATRILALGCLGILFGLMVSLLGLGFPSFLVGMPLQAFTDLSLRTLKGGSPVGYTLGYAGAVMLLVAQLYTLRLRTGAERGDRAGEMARWLRIHCYLSLAAAALVLLHSGFPLSFAYADFFRHIRVGWGFAGLWGVQGLAAWLTLTLAVSGFFGRHLYGRLRKPLRKWFRRWLHFHVATSGALYVTVVFHLLIAVVLRHVSAA